MDCKRSDGFFVLVEGDNRVLRVPCSAKLEADSRVLRVPCLVLLEADNRVLRIPCSTAEGRKIKKIFQKQGTDNTLFKTHDFRAFFMIRSNLARREG